VRLPFIAGLIVAAAWVVAANAGQLATALKRAEPATVALMLAVTAFWLVVRFVRWQYMMRRAGVRIPIRGSAAAYLAALPGTATPAYVGELIRGVLVKRRYGVPFQLTTAVLVAERLMDVLALVLILAATATDGYRWQGIALSAALLVLICAGVVLWTRRHRSRSGMGGFASGVSALTVVLILSLVSWVAAGSLVLLASIALGARLPLAVSLRVFSLSTLGGALSLMPAGIGSAGTILIVQLRELGHSLTDAIAITSLVRLTSAGAALSLGCAFLVREIRALRERGAHTMRVSGNGAGRHFDEIARDYDDQFSSHVWDHLMTGKLAMIESAVMPDIGKNAIMLDLGCGLGRQSGEMIRRGYKVTGVDLSERLLRYAVEAGVPVLSGDALRLPFADETFDVVYTIGVLHHLPDWNAQLAACAETHRVLKPGGRFLIHETNPRNPLFRFYMGYVFPLLKSIDEGTEVWIPPRLWKNVSGFTVQDVRYFTFLPDFVPRVLMGPLAALEKRLESSRLRSQSVHYLAVLEKGKTPAFNPSRATVPSSEFAPLRGA
jgi:ubiquinone/menaquinone biosynthesis C-methylase UbiE/uncharacterized membrane protein YbhN (UPF0104 family)